SSSADSALWLRMHPSPKAKRAMFVKRGMPQVSLIHPPPQWVFLSRDCGFWQVLDKAENGLLGTLYT
ncbi:MAG TPA: hypothetical protein DCY55_02170, partial [Gammaproteobacteria bacterium]|nr:hypothetical protein [Gammaproteobacteria bacterium]